MEADAQDVIFRVFPSKVSELLISEKYLLSAVSIFSDCVRLCHASAVLLLTHVIQGASEAHQVDLIAVVTIPPVSRDRIYRLEGISPTKSP